MCIFEYEGCIVFFMDYCDCLCLKVMGMCLRIEESGPTFGAMSSKS